MVRQHHKAIFIAQKLKKSRYNFGSFGNFYPDAKEGTIYSCSDNFQAISKKLKKTKNNKSVDTVSDG